jgi:TolB-like protein/DNA-binding winged helix-turn-helix (wHTH) protein
MNYVFGDCELDTSLYALQRAGQPIRLRPKVFRVCLYLLEHRDRVVSREELCTQVWSGQFISQTTLEGVIRAVRQAVGDSGHTQAIIQTLHGYGYRFVADVEERSAKYVEKEGLPAAPAALSAADVAVSDQAASAGASVAVAPAPAAVTNAIWLEEANRRAAFEDDAEMDMRTPVPSDEQPSASPQSAQSRPWVWRVLVVAMLILSLLGGWKLGRMGREHTVWGMDKSRIAVLPFLDLSPEAGHAYFADGMTEELISQLSRIRGLTVIARTSVMKYKGMPQDVASVGRELQVGSVLEGSIRAVGKQIRINAQLIDVASQGHLWSQEYDRELTGSLSMQNDIAAEVVQQLKHQLISGEE